jgi:hypothetical protein
MLLGIGTRVKLLTIADAGVIVDKLGDGMVLVALDKADMEIPVFEEDLVREDNFLENNTVLKAELKPNIKHEIPKTPIPTPSVSKPKLGNTGIHIAFLPLKKANGEVEKLDILLLNDMSNDILFELDMVLKEEVIWSKEGVLKAIQYEKMGDIYFDDINDMPELDIFIAPVYTEGVGKKLSKVLKIKPKQLMKNYTFSNFLQIEAYIFEVFKSLDADADKSSDLAKYTQDILRNKKPLKKKDEYISPFDPIAKIDEYASFITEIDLHIELLHDNPSALNNTEIVNIQIRSFENYLAKAIRLGIPRIYVIHGVGKGKLRDMIHARLRRNSDIEYFRNEYHEKYGWGATEIVLQNW